MSNTHYRVPGKALDLCNSFGFLFAGELFLLQALTQSLPEEAVAVQLGAGVGTGSLGMVEMRPSLHMYTVDISTGGPFGGLENEVNAFRGTGLNIPFQILADSQTIWKDWNQIAHGHGIDLLFIDADHASSGLQKDIDGWLQFVNVGGYVLFHDYNSVNWSGVTTVVDKNMASPNWEKVLLVDTMIAFRKVWDGKRSERDELLIKAFDHSEEYRAVGASFNLPDGILADLGFSLPVETKPVTKRAKK